MLVELHRQQQHGLLSVKDAGSKARRQSGPAVLEAAIETASSSAMALYAGSLEQQKRSAKGSALAKGHVNRTNVTNGKRANKRMLTAILSIYSLGWLQNKSWLSKAKAAAQVLFFRQESNAYKCRCESGFPGAGFGEYEKTCQKQYEQSY